MTIIIASTIAELFHISVVSASSVSD